MVNKIIRAADKRARKHIYNSICDRISYNWTALWKQRHSNCNHYLMNTCCVTDIPSKPCVIWTK